MRPSLPRPRTLAAAASALLAVNLLFWLAGAAPASVWRQVLEATVTNGYGFGQVLAKATPLLCTGTAVAVGLRAGLFNIGAEGQLAAGILAAAVVGARLPSSTPGLLAAPLVALCVGFAGGGLGALQGWLRGRFGAHEVLTALMLNGLVATLTTWLYGGPLRVGVQVHTASVAAGARLPGLDRWFPALRGSAVSVAVLFALALPFAAHFLLERTAWGLGLRARGVNARAAEALGVAPGRAGTQALFFSGALAGLGALHYVLGAKGYAEEGLGVGVGFGGVAVAMLGGRSPWGLCAAALGLGVLAQGGLAVNATVPSDALTVAQAVLLLAATVASARRSAAR